MHGFLESVASVVPHTLLGSGIVVLVLVVTLPIGVLAVLDVRQAFTFDRAGFPFALRGAKATDHDRHDDDVPEAAALTLRLLLVLALVLILMLTLPTSVTTMVMMGPLLMAVFPSVASVTPLLTVMAPTVVTLMTAMMGPLLTMAEAMASMVPSFAVAFAPALSATSERVFAEAMFVMTPAGMTELLATPAFSAEVTFPSALAVAAEVAERVSAGLIPACAEVMFPTAATEVMVAVRSTIEAAMMLKTTMIAMATAPLAAAVAAGVGEGGQR